MEEITNMYPRTVDGVTAFHQIKSPRVQLKTKFTSKEIRKCELTYVTVTTPSTFEKYLGHCRIIKLRRYLLTVQITNISKDYFVLHQQFSRATKINTAEIVNVANTESFFSQFCKKKGSM